MTNFNKNLFVYNITEPCYYTPYSIFSYSNVIKGRLTAYHIFWCIRCPNNCSASYTPVHHFLSGSNDEKEVLEPQLTGCLLLEVTPRSKLISFPLHIVLEIAVPLSISSLCSITSLSKLLRILNIHLSHLTLYLETLILEKKKHGIS
jgi:hypothetical protein